MTERTRHSSIMASRATEPIGRSVSVVAAVESRLALHEEDADEHDDHQQDEARSQIAKDHETSRDRDQSQRDCSPCAQRLKHETTLPPLALRQRTGAQGGSSALLVLGGRQ